MASPYLTIDLNKIEHNARTLVGFCRSQGITVAGVTKVTCGHPAVAKAMLRGGVTAIADARLENIRRLEAAGIHSPFMLLRLPPLSAVNAVVAAVDLSLNSELAVLTALSAAARRRGRIHRVIIMVDLGDLREGLWPDQLLPTVAEAIRLPGIAVVGVGANLACLEGVVPSRENMSQLVALAREVERTFDMELEWVSGINSSGLELIASGQMPRGVNHARLGESILLGRETVHRRPWPGTYQDSFILHAEILELKRKPSLPIGQRSQDAFGQLPDVEDRGMGRRALLNVGREDLNPAGVTPTDPRVRILGASSGYLVADVSELGAEVRVGDELAFFLNYSALLAAMTSAYVKKRPLPRGATTDGEPRTCPPVAST